MRLVLPLIGESRREPTAPQHARISSAAIVCSAVSRALARVRKAAARYEMFDGFKITVDDVIDAGEGLVLTGYPCCWPLAPLRLIVASDTFSRTTATGGLRIGNVWAMRRP
jgi:hypothetical protein